MKGMKEKPNQNMSASYRKWHRTGLGPWKKLWTHCSPHREEGREEDAPGHHPIREETAPRWHLENDEGTTCLQRGGGPFHGGSDGWGQTSKRSAVAADPGSEDSGQEGIFSKSIWFHRESTN